MEESRRCVLRGQEIKRQFPPISTAGFVIHDCDVIFYYFAVQNMGQVCIVTPLETGP